MQNIVVELIISIRESNISNLIQYLSSYYARSPYCMDELSFSVHKDQQRKELWNRVSTWCMMESSLHLWITERILYEFLLERLFRSEEHRLYLQRTRVWFPLHTGWLTLSVTSVLENPKSSSDLYGYCIYVA